MSVKTIIDKTEKPNLKSQRDRDREKVKGIFRFLEVPGGSMEFVYKAHKGDDVEKFTLRDGEIYTLPLGVARHLNKNVWYPVHSHAVDGNGVPLVTIGQKVNRCSFSPLEFMDIEDLTPAGQGIVTVEKYTGSY